MTQVDNGILIGGVWHSCAVEVRTWHKTGLEVKPGRGGKKRTVTPDIFVVHTTAAEHPPAKVFENLLKRMSPDGTKPTPLGVEFFIDVQGVIWQCCDPVVVDSFDAGYINHRSIGVEIINYTRTKDPKLEAQWGHLRPKYETTIHGQKTTLARSHDVQLKALVALADVLTSSPKLAIPRKLARHSNGQIRTDVMTRAEVAGFQGVIGHLQFDPLKVDPGTDTLYALDAAGYK